MIIASYSSQVCLILFCFIPMQLAWAQLFLTWELCVFKKYSLQYYSQYKNVFFSLNLYNIMPSYMLTAVTKWLFGSELGNSSFILQLGLDSSLYSELYIYRYVVIIMASYCSLKFLTYFFFFDISQEFGFFLGFFQASYDKVLFFKKPFLQ